MLKLGSTYLIVKDFEKSKEFYSKLLSMDATAQNMTRWAEFSFSGNCIALFNQKFDDEQFNSGEDIESKYSKEYIRNYKNKEITYGNNFVLNFGVEDLKEEYKRVKALGIGELSDIMFLNVAMPYYFFTLEDPDGNTIEITGKY